jgi:hypothetical protein
VQEVRTVVPAPESTHHTTGLVGRLNAEWSTLLDAPASRAAVDAWRRREPRLAGLADLAAVEAAVRTGAARATAGQAPLNPSGAAPARATRGRADTTRADADELLLALLRQATKPGAPWAELAGRTVLQLMLPKAVAIARGQRGRVPDPDERISAVIACLYETIRRYPVDRRPRSVAGNLGLDTLHLFQRRTGTDWTELPTDPADPVLDPPGPGSDPVAGLLGCLQRALDLQLIDPADEAADGVDPSANPAGRERLLELLVWAVERQVVGSADAALLARAYGAERVDDGALAARLGCDRSTVCKRRLRAIRALRAAAAEFLATESAAA